jgi:hypothetical protein
MADTGVKPPTTTGATYNAWTNPTNAYANDGSYATPIRTAANSAFNMTGATVTSLYGTVRGYRAP